MCIKYVNCSCPLTEKMIEVVFKIKNVILSPIVLMTPISVRESESESDMPFEYGDCGDRMISVMAVILLLVTFR